ncbi:MAG: glycosyltransferase family 4 protein [Phycisphaerales bacterium]|jgi:glycosyltransferase involved in cell wall biosynthesis|nr:glycosyltransferase family 4 protein [Phycisphaerales bacterium]MDP6987252.1 glycosyltransferase family 4 protein [Phycisphaerales bacterium]
MSTSPATRGTILVLTQVYVPDPAAVGQYLHDAAAELSVRGYRLVVYAANRGYDDPSQVFPRRELRDGVHIRRLPLSSFGKSTIPRRVAAGLLLMVQEIVRGLCTRRLKCILVSTSPPMCPAAALIISWIRRVPICYWVMDVNPDQVIRLGKVRERSLPVRCMNWLNRRILGRSKRIVVLDRFMEALLQQKRDIADKTVVMPPWAHGDDAPPVSHSDNPWRGDNVPENAFAIMFSGNHAITTPLTTVLQAAMRMQDDADLHFFFIGGGHGKREVDELIAEESPSSIHSLPYQPLETLRYSLGAADVHLVMVADDMVGVVHPCKIYGAMAVGRPILLIGPDPCHASEILHEHNVGWHIPNGDLDGLVQILRTIRETPPEELQAMGKRAQAVVHQHFSKAVLCSRFCDVVEETA